MPAAPRPSASAAPALAAEVAIVGAGLAGATLALALARAGLAVALIDRAPPARQTLPGFDGRASAVSLGSKRLLAALGVWPRLAGGAQPIAEIRVSDGRPEGVAGWGGVSPLFLHYDHRELGEEPLGFMVENRHLRHALLAEVAASERILRLAPAEVAGVARGPAAARVALADGRELGAALVVGAEGRDSFVRRSAAIPVTTWSYPQAAIVCTVVHERPHRGIAHERFLPAGPFAILPLSGNRASIVWTERADLAEGFLGLSQPEFEAELVRRFGDFLGPVRALEGRWLYPLSFLLAARSVEPRLALVGDAAHGMHPVAGQGINIGWRDVAALAEVLVEARGLGRDLGDLGVLADYERWRRFDVLLMLAATDGINRLFSNDLGPLRLARDLGLGAVNAVGPLRRLFMRQAMGVAGDLPRLLRGEPIGP
ncbi:MAG: UbiH/UbiF/VisC/COQ6 family ubiquinone biosynthesis hydroxylase [Proteobacteria bacterium]|nr:UbiH/UbiF/VisC/COQ6 family ubiquinone biosynthesis hydroxylase [Pseudomonadota bacterium]